MHTYEITKDDKSIHIMVERAIVPENTQQYINDLNDIVKDINTHDYDLYVDGTNYIITPLDMQDTLRKHMQHIKELGFKKVTINIGDKKVLKIQVCRIANEAGLDNIEII